MKYRNPATVVILGIITCGIYSLYWMYAVTEEIEQTLERRDGKCSNGAMAILLSIITCGIYTVYWYYTQGKRVALLLEEHDLIPTDNSVAYLLLVLLLGVGPVIADVLIQSDLNKIVEVRKG